MLPDEVDKALRALGDDGTKVRGALERNFADYLEQIAPERKERSARSTALFFLLPLSRILILRFGRQIIDEVLSTRGSFEEQLAKVRERRAAERSVAADSSLRRDAAHAAHPPTGASRDGRPLDSPTGEWRNGRRAGLRSRCRVSGVSVRPRPRLPAVARAGRHPGRRRRRRSGLARPTHPILAVRCT